MLVLICVFVCLFVCIGSKRSSLLGTNLSNRALSITRKLSLSAYMVGAMALRQKEKEREEVGAGE